VVSSTTLAVPEGSSGTFTVRLKSAPASDVTVRVGKRIDGDADLTADTEMLNFTAANWETLQSVAIAAVQDADSVNGAASFDLSADGVETKTVTATEQDDDAARTPVTLRGGADAYVRDGSYAAQNFGGSAVLEVKKVSAPGWSRESFVQFDLFPVASAEAVTSAKLRLFGKLLNTAAPSAPVGLFAADASWTEAGLTWNTRPATAATPVATGTVTGTAGQWYEFDVTNYLKEQKAAGATAVAFALRAMMVSEGWAGFNSDEAADNRPELVVA
jgi:hypothetical protein